jgi:hypothetical protein
VSDRKSSASIFYRKVDPSNELLLFFKFQNTPSSCAKLYAKVLLVVFKRLWVNREKGLKFFLPSKLRLLLCGFLPTSDDPFCAYPSKDKTHADPLPASKVVAKPYYGENHGEHFAGHGYGDQQERGEC